MDITVDIETIPAQRLEVLDLFKEDAEREKQTVRAPSNYKDPEKIAEYIAAKCVEIDLAVDEKYRKTALDGTFGQIVCIGYAVDDMDPVKIYKQADWADEAFVLHEFFNDLTYRFDPSDRFKFIGHNIVGFDLRFINQRAIVCGIKPPAWFPVNPRAGSEFVFDTMTEWAGWGNRISLDRLGRALGIGGKGEFNGSMVWDAVRNGEIKRVAEYCAEDVNLTRDIYKRMNFL